MKVKDKYGIYFLHFYKLFGLYDKDLYVCCICNCDHQDIFKSKDGQMIWRSFVLDGTELEMVIEELDEKPAGKKIYFIDTGKFYGNLDNLKHDALSYYLSGLGEYNG
jgi:hypothetical protein